MQTRQSLSFFFICQRSFSIYNFKVAVLIVASPFYLCIYFLEMLFVGAARPMAGLRYERKATVLVHTPFLPQYLPAMILVFRRVLYEQWQPRKMKEGRGFPEARRSWLLGGDGDTKTKSSVTSASYTWARQRQDQIPSVRLFRDVQNRLEGRTLYPSVCVSVSV